MDRTGVFAIRIAAIDTAPGLAGSLRQGELAGDFAVAHDAYLHGNGARRLSREVEELEGFVGHEGRERSE
ncbi:hypothetical protein DYGSA30_11930 [Dyella sp. GSA-30]|nr:hypothetical protein DYGSA30_11930 [Dyella sp. GSA-30]